jgi:2-polyprenyl-3-methyl-5-hydroxy-6-metoxy-1,4-benzoquinol methylase
VVDLGCGWGTFSFAIAPLCRDVTGVDFSRKAIAICNRLLEERGLDNVQFVCASAQDTGLPPGAYDAIICADLVEHLYPADTQALYDECWRLLKPGGKLIIWTPHRGHIFEILKAHNIILKRPVSHVDYKSMRRLVNGLRAKGFAIERNYYAESHVAVMRSIERALMAVVPPLRRRIAVLASKVGASGG